MDVDRLFLGTNIEPELDPDVAETDILGRLRCPMRPGGERGKRYGD